MRSSGVRASRSAYTSMGDERGQQPLSAQKEPFFREIHYGFVDFRTIPECALRNGEKAAEFSAIYDEQQAVGARGVTASMRGDALKRS